MKCGKIFTLKLYMRLTSTFSFLLKSNTRIKNFESFRPVILQRKESLSLPECFPILNSMQNNVHIEKEKSKQIWILLNENLKNALKSRVLLFGIGLD